MNYCTTFDPLHCHGLVFIRDVSYAATSKSFHSKCVYLSLLIAIHCDIGLFQIRHATARDLDASLQRFISISISL